jgi:hypothetical protein
MDIEAFGYKEYKCKKCGWVHAALPLSAIPEVTEMYLHCFQCRTPSPTFVPAGSDDAPDGCTLQPVLVSGAWDSFFVCGPSVSDDFTPGAWDAELGAKKC